MSYIIFILVSILQVAGFAFYMRRAASGGGGGSSQELLEQLRTELQEKKDLAKKLEDTLSDLASFSALKSIVLDLLQQQDTLKTERGRATITAAEVETVETRLRELDEIERELQASGIETKEEIEILRKKHADMKSRNTTLQTQLQESNKLIDEIISKIEMGAQMLEQINLMKTELLQCEQRTELLLMQIEEGNEQYYVLKKRYDALDIEYAQLYEKFSAAEAA